MTSATRKSLQESLTTSDKDKNSTEEAVTGRVVKHRSSQACQSCRKRKVRCDVLTNGSPCTNCRLDNVECVILASRRGKPRHIRRKNITQTMNSPTPQSADNLGDSNPSITQSDLWPTDEAEFVPTTAFGASQVPASVTFDEDSDKTRSDQQPVSDHSPRAAAEHASSEAYNGLLTPETGTNTVSQHQSLIAKVQLPAFIAPLSDRTTGEDLNFLAQKGALIVPQHDLCIEIIKGYFFSVHPYMPMLDFEAFTYAVVNNREDCQISLLLFQAVMFAGLHSLHLSVIHRLGFQSVKQARKVFLDRARLLYDFDVENDSTAIFQSLLLMSLWYGERHDRKHTWHYTGLAYDVARSMGLHRESTPKYSSKKMRCFRRRLWWCLYIRDRLIALGTRRPMRIRDEDFDTAMLTMEDFDIATSCEPNQAQSFALSMEEYKSTALMCIQLAKLCVCIGHVVSSQYSVLSNQSDVPPTMMVVSKRNKFQTQELETCDRELNEWFHGLDTNMQGGGSSAAQHSPQTCAGVHWAILNITYLTVVNVLHRAQALQPLADAAETQVIQRSSRSKVKDAARGLTKISQAMLHRDQTRYLGPVGVTALVAACLSHMLDVSSGDADVRDASIFRLHQSLEVLQSLSESYASADAAISFLTSITRKAGITLPARFVARAGDSFGSPTEVLVLPTTGGRQATEWKESTGYSGRNRSLLNEQPEAFVIGGQPDRFRILTPSADTRGQPQPLIHVNGQLSFNDTVTRSGSLSNRGVEIVEHNLPETPRNALPPDTTLAACSNQAADGALLDWSNSMDTGMEFESMAFNYDFYSNAFGFFDGDRQGV